MISLRGNFLINILCFISWAYLYIAVFTSWFYVVHDAHDYEIELSNHVDISFLPMVEIVGASALFCLLVQAPGWFGLYFYYHYQKRHNSANLSLDLLFIFGVKSFILAWFALTSLQIRSHFSIYTHDEQTYQHTGHLIWETPELILHALLVWLPCALAMYWCLRSQKKHLTTLQKDASFKKSHLKKDCEKLGGRKIRYFIQTLIAFVSFFYLLMVFSVMALHAYSVPSVVFIEPIYRGQFSISVFIDRIIKYIVIVPAIQMPGWAGLYLFFKMFQTRVLDILWGMLYIGCNAILVIDVLFYGHSNHFSDHFDLDIFNAEFTLILIIFIFIGAIIWGRRRYSQFMRTN